MSAGSAAAFDEAWLPPCTAAGGEPHKSLAGYAAACVHRCWACCSKLCCIHSQHLRRFHGFATHSRAAGSATMWYSCLLEE